LWVRSLDSTVAHVVPGTEGAAHPFWSPNGRAIGFFADEKLKTVAAADGPPVVLADAPVPGGGTWSRDGTILFVPHFFKGMYQVPASGGTPVPVIRLDESENQCCAYPQYLPDGRHFLYWASGVDASS